MSDYSFDMEEWTEELRKKVIRNLEVEINKGNKL